MRYARRNAVRDAQALAWQALNTHSAMQQEELRAKMYQQADACDHEAASAPLCRGLCVLLRPVAYKLHAMVWNQGICCLPSSAARLTGRGRS